MLTKIKSISVLNAAYESTKKMLRQNEHMRILSKKIRRNFASGEEIAALSRLIEQNRVVVLKPYLHMKGDETGCLIAHDVIRDFLSEYQTIRLRKTRMDQVAVPTDSVLLRYPLALLAVPPDYNHYLKVSGEDNRRMIRKAEKGGYSFREFNWDDYLDDIFKINTSKEMRSGGVMHGWYRESVKPRTHSSEEQYYLKYYGIFKQESLCAYLHVILCGDCGYFKHFMGHADHLKNGIMNYLVSCTVREYVAHSHIIWMNYGIFPIEQSGGTIAFRKHAGFVGYATFLDLEDDQELLKYSRRVRAIGLTSI